MTLNCELLVKFTEDTIVPRALVAIFLSLLFCLFVPVHIVFFRIKLHSIVWGTKKSFSLFIFIVINLFLTTPISSIKFDPLLYLHWHALFIRKFTSPCYMFISDCCSTLAKSDKRGCLTRWPPSHVSFTNPMWHSNTFGICHCFHSF